MEKEEMITSPKAGLKETVETVVFVFGYGYNN